MSNVLEFTGKHLPLEQIIKHYVDQAREHIPEKLSELLMMMNNDMSRQTLHTRLFDTLTWGLLGDEFGNFIGVSFKTTARPNLFPEFGIQNYNDFLILYWTRSDQDITVDHELEEIGYDVVYEKLTEYYVESFPNLNFTNKIAFSYSIASAICLSEDFRIIHCGMDKDSDCFIISFEELDENKQVVRRYGMQCKFLPIILDSLALKWYGENNPSET